MLVLTSFAILTYFNYRSCRDVWFPGFIASVIWLTVWILYRISPTPVDPVSAKTSLIFVITVLSFTGGAQLALLLRPPNARSVNQIHRSPSLHPRLKKSLLLVSAILLPVMFAKANQLANQSGNPSWFMGLRTELLATDTRSYGLLSNAFTLSLFTTLVYAVELGEDRKERLQYYASVLISFLFAALSMGRAPFLQIIVPLIGIAAIQKRLKLKTLIACALFVVLVFGAFVVVLAKAGDSEAPLSENLWAVQESFVEYTIGSLPAFDQVVRSNPPAEYGLNSFVATVNLLQKVEGAAPENPDLWTEVPFPINVYTAIRPPFLDFGIVGVILAFGAIGAASSYSYLRAIRGESAFLFFYSLSLYPLLMMTFDDQYFSPMLYWLKYALVAYLFFRISRKRQIMPSNAAYLKTKPS